jgi:hypothetical protein
MGDEIQVIELGERVAEIARELNIETIVIGAYAMAIHKYVRGSLDFDLGTRVELDDLRRLMRALDAKGLSTRLNTPDDQDDLGGKLVVWNRVDDDGDPLEPVEVVNFYNVLRPRKNPAAEAIKNAITLEERPALRYPRLADLIALKLDAGGPKDLADVIELLRQNPDADVEEIRATSKKYGFDKIDGLIEHAKSDRR